VKEKSGYYDGVCEKYLHSVLQNTHDEVSFAMAKDDISGIEKDVPCICNGRPIGLQFQNY